MKELICIVCPKGCHLKVDTEHGKKVSGNACIRGAEYGYKEVTAPTRVVTTTVRLENGKSRRLPVKTNAAIPKGLIFQCMEVINSLSISAPVKRGDVLVKNILGTGVDLVACKDELQ
jgi:CxxC motif-containing protein